MEFLEGILDWFGAHQPGIIALGVFIAAGASMYGSYMSAQATHRSRIAELRERWIERLRNDISKITEARIINYRMHRNEFTLEEYIDQVSKIKLIFNNVRLRLNENEEKHRDLIELIERYIDKDHHEQMLGLETAILDVTRQIIREEWKKAAKGKL